MRTIAIRIAVNGDYGAASASTSIDNAVPGNDGKTPADIEALRDATHDRIRQAKREMDEQFDVLVTNARKETH